MVLVLSPVRLRRSALYAHVITAFMALCTALLPVHDATAQGNVFRPKQGLYLIEPIDPSLQTLPNMNGIDIFFAYFNVIWPWLIGSAAGFAVLQGMVGGFMMMMSGGDSGMRGEGQAKLQWAILGMLLIAFSGFLLRVINPLFFR
jgi:hypothetical protein